MTAIDTTAGAQQPQAEELHHNVLGVRNIVFFVLAGAAPLGAMTGAAPLVVALGNGGGAPGAYVLAALALVAFAAGYAAMSRRVANAGAFYAYICQGLAKPLGAGAAYVAILSYNAVILGVLGALGAFATPIFADKFGIDLDWWIWAFLALGLIAFLSHRRIELSAGVLAGVLVLEVLLLLAMDVGIIVERGLSALSFEAFSPSTVFSVAPGLALLFAFTSFIGFEATAIFAEEAKDRERTIPRATYWAIGIIGVFYAFTVWCLVAWYGVADAQQAALDDVGTFVFAPNAATVGGFATDVMEVLVIVSFFASCLALHNAASRYNFSLAREGLLPRALAHTHPKHGSPWIGSGVGIAILGVALLVTALSGVDPYLGMGAVALALGTIGIIGLQAATSFAVIGFFNRDDEEPFRPWSMLIGPLIGGVALSAVVYLGLDNWGLLSGFESGWQGMLPWLLVLVLAAGIGVGLKIRRGDPQRYAALGGSVESAAAPTPAGDDDANLSAV